MFSRNFAGNMYHVMGLCCIVLYIDHVDWMLFMNFMKYFFFSFCVFFAFYAISNIFRRKNILKRGGGGVFL